MNELSLDIFIKFDLEIDQAFMTNLLDVMKGQLTYLDNESGRVISPAILRANSLLLRSLLSTVTSVAVQLPNFFHPFLQRTLTSSLLVYGFSVSLPSSSEGKQVRPHFPEQDLLLQDLDRLLRAIAAEIPPRLAIPTLLAATPSILAIGSQLQSKTLMFTCASRYAALLRDLWQNLDRSAVIANIKDLSTLATLLLDYRCVYGDQSAEMDAVDEAVASALLQLCLKLTETELRHLLLRLIEWRDVPLSITDESWRTHSRSVSFYSLILELVSTLKGIFLPSISLVWSHAATTLASLEKVVAAEAEAHSQAQFDE